MVDVTEFLNRKYANLENQAATQRLTAQANAARQYAETREVAPNAESMRGVQRAQRDNLDATTKEIPANAASQRGLQGAQANRLNVDAYLAPSLANSQISLQGAQATNQLSSARSLDVSSNIAQGNYELSRSTGGSRKVQDKMRASVGLDPLPDISDAAGAATAPMARPPILTPGYGLGINVFDPARKPMLGEGIGGRSMFDQPLGMEFAKGTARVPGNGDGTQDTVPAKLAPGEAVLNKAAAEGMGRGLIALMNKLGAQKMGMT